MVSVEGKTLHLSVPTKFLKSWIQAHYLDKIRHQIVAENSFLQDVSIGVRSGSNPAAGATNVARFEPASRAAPSSRAHSDEPATSKSSETSGLGAGHGLDRRMTFASFQVGRSNALAHAAGRQIAENPTTSPHLNPLYVHSGVGLGKTHLLQAIAHEASGRARRVTYLSADAFMYGFVAALKSQSALAFKEKMRGIDLLVIDDVQFLQGKQVQQEFCHTLNALLDSGKQIVVAADRAPGELESLDERVRSRLAGGLVVEMLPLDEDIRVKILETRIAVAKASHPSFMVDQAVVSHVARRLETNGRDLDGAINRLLAHVTLTSTPLTIETAELAIRDLIKNREPRKVKIEDIQKLVANHYNVSRSDILSSRRTANVVRPRQVAMYLSKVLTPRSLPEIGRRFGGRDHTTVLHAVRKVEDLVTRDSSLREDIELFKRMLTE